MEFNFSQIHLRIQQNFSFSQKNQWMKWTSRNELELCLKFAFLVFFNSLSSVVSAFGYLIFSTYNKWIRRRVRGTISKQEIPHSTLAISSLTNFKMTFFLENEFNILWETCRKDFRYLPLATPIDEHSRR